jgi:hypothetical protein
VRSRITIQRRAKVAGRANHSCEYCLVTEDDAGFPHQVDHIISQKHGGSSALDNLAFACMLCNQRKGTDIACVDPVTGNLVPLFHPRRDQWSEHFRIEREFIEPVSRVGFLTIRLLQLNSVERQRERAMLQRLGSYPTQPAEILASF